MTPLEQFEQLRLTVPRISFNTVNNTNSPYCQYTERSKNCYMTFASYESEDCSYNHRVFYCKDCNDCTLCHKCQLCYECLDCINCYNCNRCDHCENSSDSEHCHYCISAKDCFGCAGLIQSRFQIFNQQFSKEDYHKKIAEYKSLSDEQIQTHMEKVLTQVPRTAMYGKKNENSYGENLHNSKSSYWAFDSKGLWDCNFCYHCDDSKNLLQCSHLGWSELCYEIMSGGNLNNCIFCYGCWHSNDLTYCDIVYNSKNCFMCTGLNHAKNCILNKQYDEETYKTKKTEMITEMKKNGTWGKWYSSAYPEVIVYGL